jgi:hypothetical protein
VEVDDNRLVGGEQALEGLFIQSMGVLARLAENEQVVDVDDSDSDTSVSEQGSGSNGLESDFNTTSDKYDIGVDTTFGGESLPDGGTSDTVLFSLMVSWATSLAREGDLPLQQRARWWWGSWNQRSN